MPDFWNPTGVWDPEQIARDHGHAVITIEPTGDAGDLVDASEPAGQS